MRVLVTVVQEGAPPYDVMVNADDDAVARDVAQALAASGAGPWQAERPSQVVVALPGTVLDQRYGGRSAEPVLWADGHRCDPDTPAGRILRDGMRVSVDDSIGPLLRKGEPVGWYELRVAGGPGAGRIARLGVGTATFGSATTCTLAAPDPVLAPVAGQITVDVRGGASLTPQHGSTLLLDDEPVEAAQDWPLGGVVRAGDSLFVLDRVGEPDAHLSATGEGGLAYNRPPRLSPVRPRPRLSVPVEPSKTERTRFQTISALTPMIFGLVMYFVTRQVYMLLFCAMSPVMMLGQWISDNRDGKQRNKKSLKQYRSELAAYEAELARLGKEDQRNRRADNPDPAEVLLFATGPRRRLWERRRTDVDVMRLRVGVGTLYADIEIAHGQGAAYGEEQPEPPLLSHLPVTLSFPGLGVVGVSGDRPRALATAHWLAVQAAVLHSPRELSIVFLAASAQAGADWNWAHWLPHAAPQQGQDCVALVGCDSEAIARRVNELLNELARRKAAQESSGAMMSGAPGDEPHILLVLDGARLLRRMPGVPQLLQEGPRHGIFALCLDEDDRLLPEECKAVVCWTPHSPTHVQLRGSGLESVGEVLADQVGPDWCDLLARSLAPVRDVSRDDAGGALPTAARLLSLLDMPDPSGADIERTWRAGGSTTAAPIGIAADGVFTLDIRRDGPHGAGRGHDRLRQVRAAADDHRLAGRRQPARRPQLRPHRLQGRQRLHGLRPACRTPSAWSPTSTPTSPSGPWPRSRPNCTAASTMLANTGAKDIEDYNDTRGPHAELEPMPRLVLVIDEFASLVAELPDFVAGLVDIARRGRSLGVHLVLATQRPAGVVSADIRANTNLRIALRVTDGSESMDVIDAADAGAIAKSTPGRAYVRSGAQSLVGVQSARIGGRRPATGKSGPKAVLSPLPWTAFSRPLPRSAESEDDGTMVTDLAVLVDAIRGGSDAMGFPPPRSPWLPPLPEHVTLEALTAAAGPAPAHGDVPPIGFALTDLPAQQARKPFALDLVAGEHTMLAGGARVGPFDGPAHPGRFARQDRLAA